MAGLQSSSSEMDLYRPNIEEYLAADSIQDSPKRLHLRDLLDISPTLTEAAGAIVDREMESKQEEPKDFLESSVLLDESQYQEGYKDGFNDGMLTGKDEGKDVGLKHGFQVGEEIGFYQGCLDIWSSAIKIEPNAFSSRVQKRIEQLQDMVTSYPLLEPENEQLQDMMQAIRLKFRIITANLGLSSTLTYEGHPKSSNQELETI